MENEIDEFEEEVIDLREIWGVIVRGRWYILLGFVLVVGATGFFTFTADEVYQSEAKIMQESSQMSSDSLAALAENPLSGLGGSQNTLRIKKRF